MRNPLACLLIAAAAAFSSPATAATCAPPAEPEVQGIRFLLGIQPSDGILDVWCRIQALSGDYRINVLFPGPKAHKSFDATFDGKRSRSREELASFIRGLLPTGPGPKADGAGMKWPEVLATNVQAMAPTAPDGQGLGIPAVVPGASSIALWAPIVLRVKPLKLGDGEFTLIVSFKPSAARLLMAMTGSAERFQVQGWRNRVLTTGFFMGSCPATIPSCKELPDVVPMETAWLVDSVRIEASGGGLSRTALTVLGNLAEENKPFLQNNSMPRFSPMYGEAEIIAEDGSREVQAVAVGDENRASGTQSIVVQWRERPNSKTTYAMTLANWMREARAALVLQYGPKPGSKP